MMITVKILRPNQAPYEVRVPKIGSVGHIQRLLDVPDGFLMIELRDGRMLLLDETAGARPGIPPANPLATEYYKDTFGQFPMTILGPAALIDQKNLI